MNILGIDAPRRRAEDPVADLLAQRVPVPYRATAMPADAQSEPRTQTVDVDGARVMFGDFAFSALCALDLAVAIDLALRDVSERESRTATALGGQRVQVRRGAGNAVTIGGVAYGLEEARRIELALSVAVQRATPARNAGRW